MALDLQIVMTFAFEENGCVTAFAVKVGKIKGSNCNVGLNVKGANGLWQRRRQRN